MNHYFSLFDDDETGRLSRDNLYRVARELGEEVTIDQLQEMIDDADADGVIQKTGLSKI